MNRSRFENKSLVKKYFVRRISKTEFECKICGEHIFEGKGVAPEKSLYNHFWNKHRELMFIIVFQKNDKDTAEIFEKIKQKYEVN